MMTLVEAITYLNENSSGRGSFIPMNMKPSMAPPVYLNGNPGILGKALNFVECERRVPKSHRSVTSAT